MLPLIMITIIANGVKGGLAESIGIRFVKKNTTYAIFIKEGMFVVMLAVLAFL